MRREAASRGNNVVDPGLCAGTPIGPPRKRGIRPDLDTRGERTPLPGAEREPGAAGILAVPHRDDASPGLRDLDAFGLPVAVAASAPRPGGGLVAAHCRSSSAALLISPRDARSSSPASRMLLNAF